MKLRALPLKRRNFLVDRWASRPDLVLPQLGDNGRPLRDGGAVDIEEPRYVGLFTENLDNVFFSHPAMLIVMNHVVKCVKWGGAAQ